MARGECGAEGPRAPAPRKLGKMHKGDSSRRCRRDALLQERIWGGAVRMPRTGCSLTRRPSWEPRGDATKAGQLPGAAPPPSTWLCCKGRCVLSWAWPGPGEGPSCPRSGDIPGITCQPQAGGGGCTPHPSPTLPMHPQPFPAPARTGASLSLPGHKHQPSPLQGLLCF